VTQRTKSLSGDEKLEAVVSAVVEDHSDWDQVLREAIFQENTEQLNMRLPPAMKAVLSKFARQRATPYSCGCATESSGAGLRRA
jgi:hypothetical protein